MGVNYFTDEQVEYLRKNKYVKHVSNKGITYTLEFKELLEKEFGLKVIMEDERLTSVISNNVLNISKTKINLANKEE